MEKIIMIKQNLKMKVSDTIIADEAYNTSTVKDNVVPFESYRTKYKLRKEIYSFPLSSTINYTLKRSIDIVFSLLFIIAVLSWLTPLLGIIILIDSRGPIFFYQKRRKNIRQLFTCIKFRTMFVNDEADLKAAMVDDSRVTRVGKLLRHYHLDELPQLFNVLKGDMSLIGPRPYMLAEDDRYEKVINEYDLRYKVKPGITGLAQSLGEFGYTEDIQQMKERVELDIAYAIKWTIWMDIKIASRTILEVMGFKMKPESIQTVLKNY
jgi:lipopolysaccharide/colanic/teichoic acid biosynthesis glycosyltransferase